MSKTSYSLGFIQLINNLEKCSSLMLLYDTLVQIRTSVIKDSEGIKLLKDKGGLKRIVSLLGKPNEKLLNVSLSILANCCLQEECREQVISCGAIPRIVNILKNLNEDNIQNRACRLVGNLTQSKKIAEKLHESQITSLLVSVLNNTTCTGTVLMAIRALRMLWDVHKFRFEMTRAESIKAVAVHLSSENKDVKTAVLKALAVFTHGLTSYGIANQVKGGQPNFKWLLAELGNPQANICLYNLSGLATSRLDLIKDGLAEAIITLTLSRWPHSHDSWITLTLCNLCQESLGRANVRSVNNGLKLLVTIFQNTSKHPIQARVLKALSDFVYDMPSLKILLRHGVVAVLIKNVAKYVSQNGRLHEMNSAVTEPLHSCSPCGSGMSPRGQATGRWSPMSEDRSLPPSPISVYSPLCISDDEELEATPILTDDDVAVNTAQQKIEEEPSNVDVNDIIFTFLLHINNSFTSPIPDFVIELTISTLIDYICLIKNANPKAGRLLCGIAGKKLYFLHLLDEQLVLQIHRRMCRPIHEQCSECDRILDVGSQVLLRMLCIASSLYGEGELLCRLGKEDRIINQTTALTIPYLIRDSTKLSKFLYPYCALDNLMEALRKGDIDAIVGFSEIFKTFSISNPQQFTEICSSCDVRSFRKEATITFVLDDGSIVTANKSTLCNSSPVFEAMFRGNFKEAKQAEVKLSDISAECCKHFFRILDTYCECVLPKDIQILLEMIIVCDRFLVPHIGDKILSVVMNHSLNHRTCGVVYNWALDVGNKYPELGKIAVDVVKFIFTAQMLPFQRILGVQDLLESTHSKEFLEDILELLKCPLQVVVHDNTLAHKLNANIGRI